MKGILGEEVSSQPRTRLIQSAWERRDQSTLESRDPVSLGQGKSIQPGRGGDLVSLGEEDPVNLVEEGSSQRRRRGCSQPSIGEFHSAWAWSDPASLRMGGSKQLRRGGSIFQRARGGIQQAEDRRNPIRLRQEASNLPMRGGSIQPGSGGIKQD